MKLLIMNLMEKNYKGTIRYKIYDHFGLDTKDVNAFKRIPVLEKNGRNMDGFLALLHGSFYNVMRIVRKNTNLMLLI